MNKLQLDLIAILKPILKKAQFLEINMSIIEIHFFN